MGATDTKEVSEREREIGAAVRMARQRVGMTQQAVADRLNKSLDAIKKMERGERVFQWLVCAETAEALQTTPNELLGFPVAPVEAMEAALKPILAVFGANPDDADSIARILLEAVEAAQALPDEGPAPLRYKMAGQLAAARSRGR